MHPCIECGEGIGVIGRGVGEEELIDHREAVVGHRGDGLAGLVAREARVVGDLLCGLERCVK